MKNCLLRTNHGSAIDFRPAGRKDPVATCPIPEWVRMIADSSGHVRHSDLNLQQRLARALFVASLERASFSLNDQTDKEIKEGVRLYISTWLIPPLLAALEEVNGKEEA